MFGPVVELARAKINLALHVLGRRADGYHELDSIVAFADVGDVLTFVPADSTELVIKGPFGAGLSAGSDNLILQALAALKQHVTLPPVNITLEKNLPVASGIGGGSADAAATLRGLQRIAGQSLPTATLMPLALQLGADVPVCMEQSACRMQGIGEHLLPLESVPAPAIVLVNPGVACGTADVFRSLGLQPGQTFGKALDPREAGAWRNDLQHPAISVQPLIGEVLQSLQTVSHLHTVRMSGSGATCFGLANAIEHANEAAEKLRARHPAWWIAAARLS